MNDAHTLYLTEGSGNSFKPALIARQLDRNCDLEFIDVLGGETRQEAFLGINPLGVVPYLVSADGRGLGESNAIAWFLAEGSTLIPPDTYARAQAIQWMTFEQTSLEPNISPARFFTHIVPSLREQHEQDIPGWLEAGHRALGVLDTYLKTRSFVTDHGYSVADVAVYGYTHLAEEGGFALADYRGVARWMERIETQPGYLPIGELLSQEPIQA